MPARYIPLQQKSIDTAESFTIRQPGRPCSRRVGDFHDNCSTRRFKLHGWSLRLSMAVQIAAVSNASATAAPTTARRNEEQSFHCISSMMNELIQ